MADPKDKDPAEGSRRTIENELKRKGSTDKGSDRPDDGSEQKGPAQPRST
ncbi:hypothetical protein [Neorhizobium petrolearium]